LKKFILKMKNIKFKLCKLILERFKAYTEERLLGRRMEKVKIIRQRDIADVCALFGVNYWKMFRAIHQDYVIS